VQRPFIRPFQGVFVPGCRCSPHTEAHSWAATQLGAAWSNSRRQQSTVHPQLARIKGCIKVAHRHDGPVADALVPMLRRCGTFACAATQLTRALLNGMGSAIGRLRRPRYQHTPFGERSTKGATSKVHVRRLLKAYIPEGFLFQGVLLLPTLRISI